MVLESKVKQVQKYLKENNFPAWLLYDFRGINPIAVDFLNLKGMKTRRWYYLIRAEGEPIALVHKIEEKGFKELPGKIITYVSWKDLREKLKETLKGLKTVAMEYSNENNIPYVSRVDAGTIELIRSLGVEVVSSADLVQYFQARWDNQQYLSHKEAASNLMRIKDEAFSFITHKISENKEVNEFEVVQFIMNTLTESGMETEDTVICAVNENSGNPHYSPTRTESKIIKRGDLVLLDIWAKMKKEKSVYADITWVGYAGEKVPEKYERIFKVVKDARDVALDFLKEKWSKGEEVKGWEVDQVCRDFIQKAGYGDYFTHRTGHSIGTEGHGNGVNIDNLETRDERRIIPGVGFSVEPGIYLSDFGIRSEVNVYVKEKEAEVTTLPLQEEIIPIMKMLDSKF
ncbi:MAG: M24 family metallopeptidase [candidate division Zixibacteria bacterium]|nr:M24 family metallopeptidase [candidate division Zixibacteria bacterium]